MWAERYLRRVKLRRRFTIAGILLVLPMTCLIVASVIVLQQQEADIHQAIDEGVNVLVPLTTLEYDLQRALTDELDAQTGQSVPDYGGLSVSIDRLLSHLRSSPDNPDLSVSALDSAALAWQSARPVIRRLVEQVAPVHLDGASTAARNVQRELAVALQDVERARVHLAQAVKARTAQAVSAQKRQLRLLVWCWAATLCAAFLVAGALVYSIVRPARELGRAVERLSTGDLSVRIEGTAKDELGHVAAYLNAMAARFATRRSALETEARQDALTQLPNRRAITDALDSALEASRGLGVPLSILMIDVDRFKQINDQFGHGVGDEALVWLSGTMRACFRGQDILGRYAGDEFLAVLPETAGDQARVVAERLCERVAKEANVDPRKPSVTIGLATSSQILNSSSLLLQAADQALYRGKEQGRSRVVEVGN